MYDYCYSFLSTSGESPIFKYDEGIKRDTDLSTIS